MTIPAYPLQWPAGWKRTESAFRAHGRFGRKEKSSHGDWRKHTGLTIAQALERVRTELGRMGIHDDDLVINSNLELRLDGFPRSSQREPADPGIAVYWRDKGETRCMAID